MIEINEHNKAVAEEFEKLASAASAKAKEENVSLARSLGVVFGAATIGTVSLAALEAVKDVSPYYRAILGGTSVLYALTALTTHTVKNVFYNNVSKVAKKKEMDIRNGFEQAQENLPYVEEVEQLAADNFSFRNVFNFEFHTKAIALCTVMGIAGTAYWLSEDKENVAIIERQRNNQSNNTNLTSPQVMSDPPRQPAVPMFR